MPLAYQFLQSHDHVLNRLGIFVIWVKKFTTLCSTLKSWLSKNASLFRDWCGFIRLNWLKFPHFFPFHLLTYSTCHLKGYISPVPSSSPSHRSRSDPVLAVPWLTRVQSVARNRTKRLCMSSMTGFIVYTASQGNSSDILKSAKV
jgi:hypothetical protein